jgi:cytochrome c oxidase assembly protein subunit 15
MAIHIVSFAQLAVTGLLVACLPLGMVWLSSDANKYRKLVWVAVFLTFDLVVFGGFTRLTDSGLGCPDWPGCYGLANPFQAHAQISAAETLLPTGPVTVVKAWIEMIHRYLAMGIGVLIVTLMIKAWLQWRQRHLIAFKPGLPTALFGFFCLQGAFGAWTVTMKLQPVIVTTHLILGMGLLAMLTWLGARQDRLMRSAETGGSVPPGLRTAALVTAIVLLVQIALGGWVSTNYATLACNEYPTCGGAWIPPMDFEHGFTLWRELGKTAAGHYLPFSALTAIHWVHRNFAIALVLVAGWTAMLAWRVPATARLARYLVAALSVQALTGLATIFLSFPLAIAVLHNAGAAVLVIVVTMLNYRVQHPFAAARSMPS